MLTAERGFNPVLLALLLFVPTTTISQGNQKRGEAVQCASLIYSGNRTATCFSDGFLKRIAAETRILVETAFHKVRLDGKELTHFPFAVMSGEGGFTLHPKERDQLRYYVTHGGFLLASAGCSDPNWSKAFRAEFARLFPGQKLVRLKRDHLLYRMVYRIDTLATVHKEPGATEGWLEAFTYKGRITLVFSPQGLNDTRNVPNCCCCGGDELDRAEFINVNVLAYALLR